MKVAAVLLVLAGSGLVGACSFEITGGYRAVVHAEPATVWSIVLDTTAQYGLDLERGRVDGFRSAVRVLDKKVEVRVEPVGSGRSRLSVHCDCEGTATRELLEAIRGTLADEGIEMEDIPYPASLPRKHPGPVLSELLRRREELGR
jgi:hypothetical protein